MLQVNCCTFCMLSCLFITTTDSRTAHREGSPGAFSDGTNVIRATDDTDYSNMQHAVPGYGDQEDWETTRNRILGEAMDSLSTVSSVEDLLKLGFVDSDGNPLTPQGLSAVYGSSTDKLLINGNGEVAMAAQCSPREVAVPINVTELQANTVLHPKCITVLRCGGCCNLPNVACQPVATQKVIYKLMKLTLERNDPQVRMSGSHKLEVTQHSQCSCSCSLSQDSCGPLKTFNAAQCSCGCKAYVRCSPPRFFNPDTCKCQCADRPTCCPDGAGCALRFNESTCECEVHDELFIASSTNQLQGHTSHDGSQVAGGDTAKQSQTSLEMNQITQDVTSDSCLGVVCPFSFERQVNSEGRCMCTHRHRHKGGRK